jgi:tRNA nucleotidyltransferase (CCA-adding enzyme)
VAPITVTVPEFVAFIIKRLRTAGHEAFVVGGAVRDALLKRPIMDWDVATAASSAQISTLFCDERQFALGHETVTLVRSGSHVEVTPFRGVENRLVSDLSRRDFTINAMALDVAGMGIVDPFEGTADIRRRLLRAVENPEERFREDPLRLLRCVRIAAELGFQIDGETAAGLGKMAPLLASVAAERIRDELVKVLMTPRPSLSFFLMARTGILASFLPELLEGYRKRQNHHHRYTIFRHMVETVDAVRPDPVLRLAALLHDVAKPRVRIKRAGTWRFYGHEEESARMAEAILNRLRFSREMTKRVVHLIAHHMIGYDPGWSDAAIRRLIRRAGPDGIRDLLEFRRADLLAHGFGDQDVVLLDELECRVEAERVRGTYVQTRDLAVDGNAVMAVTGLSPGPEVGRILDDLNERVLEHPELNNREELTALIKLMSTSP